MIERLLMPGNSGIKVRSKSFGSKKNTIKQILFYFIII